MTVDDPTPLEDIETPCDWCGDPVKVTDMLVLDLDMPYYQGPYMHIRNSLCSDCQPKVCKVLGELELQIRKEAYDRKVTKD